MKTIQIPDIPEKEKTEVVKLLLNIISQHTELIQKQREEIQLLKDEIARLKGKPKKPNISPSTMDSSLPRKKRSKKKKKRGKPKPFKIDKTEHLHPENIPNNSQFREYKDFIVQDIQFEPFITKYRRGKWKTPDGEYILAPLPKDVKGHYGAHLKSFMLYLNYELNVTQPLIHELLQSIGIRISSGTVDKILNEDKESFHNEKEQILATGLALSDYVVVDDTGARHAGKNGYCTHIGNEYFAYFKSSPNKSRVNFLQILRGEHTDYVLNMDALQYMRVNSLPKLELGKLRHISETGKTFATHTEWDEFLKKVGIHKKDHVRIVTEAALTASILLHGFNTDLVIVSDEAGQFNVFLHALCWIHAERKLRGIIPINDYQKEIIDTLLESLWELYRDLKLYKKNPGKEKRIGLEKKFDILFTTETEFEVINNALGLIYKNKEGLLLVLKRPEIPLHNNESENDIRTIAQKRKVHGQTKGFHGRKSRDTFMSLKKTCKKLEISFFEYLYDRISGNKTIPFLYTLMEKRVCNNSP
jgi:hypothetical protein